MKQGLELSDLAGSGRFRVNEAGSSSEIDAQLTHLGSLDVLGWQSMDTAPRDGTAILIFQPGKSREYYMPNGALGPNESSYRTDDARLLWYDDNRFAVGYWRPWGGWGNRNAATVNPTRWMPLPAPPVQP